MHRTCVHVHYDDALMHTVYALMQGIKIHRVHDVKQVSQAVKVFEKLNSV